MLQNKDILELKKRFKKDHCTFTKMCGCYVNGEKNILLKFRETFLNLEEDDYFKETVGKVIKTREEAKKKLTQLGFTFPDSYSNFIFATHKEKSAKYIFEELKKRGVKHIYLVVTFALYVDGIKEFEEYYQKMS